MSLTKIVEGAYLVVPMGTANAVLLDAGPELVLIDAGWPGKAAKVLEAIRQLGRSPGDLKHLVFTHGHPDHIGSAAALLGETGATTYMHALDAPFAESGGPFWHMTAAPGIIAPLIFAMVWRPNEKMEPFHIDQHLADGETLPLAGGLQVIHVPGHCAGQVAFLWQDGRLLIGGDVFTNFFGLSDPVGFENRKEGRRSQRKLAELTFEAAVFGHGKVITSGADRRIRQAVR